MKMIIAPEWDGYEIKKIVFHELGYSSGMVKRLKNMSDGILLDEERVNVRTKVRTGQCLCLHCEDTGNEVNSNIDPIDIPINIVYEDDNVIAINKPSGMPTIPTHGHRNDTLANALIYKYSKIGIPFVFRPVNRLDRETSGIVLVAKNRLSAKICSEELATGGFIKKYIAITNGIPNKKSGTIKGYIRREMPSIIQRGFYNNGLDSEYSETDYYVIGEKDNLAIVVLYPKTGRTHQIRVHLSHIGCPILGDSLYDIKSNNIDRCALHAGSLEFTIPGTNLRKYVCADIPEDMKNIYDYIMKGSDNG